MRTESALFSISWNLRGGREVPAPEALWVEDTPGILQAKIIKSHSYFVKEMNNEHSYYFVKENEK